MAIIRVADSPVELCTHGYQRDCERCESRKVAPTVVDQPSTWDVGSFTPQQVAAAVDKVNAFPGFPADDNQLATFWPQARKMPTITDVDFGDVKPDTVDLKNLLSSNRTVKRDRLLWHVQNPGQRLHANPFTTMPLVAATKAGTVIVDGHHSLGALWLLGATKAPVWSLPMTAAAQ